jgi:DNA-binding MarR family transcriptional regulator
MKIKKFAMQSPVVGIMATQLKLSRFLDKKFSSIDLGYLEAMILATLFFEDGKMVGPSQISRDLMYPLPRISLAISSLQSAGLISREIVKSDSRKTKLVLTTKGTRSATQCIGIFNSIQDSIEKSISESRALQVNAGLLKLRSEVFV